MHTESYVCSMHLCTLVYMCISDLIPAVFAHTHVRTGFFKMELIQPHPSTTCPGLPKATVGRFPLLTPR